MKLLMAFMFVVATSACAKKKAEPAPEAASCIAYPFPFAYSFPGSGTLKSEELDCVDVYGSSCTVIRSVADETIYVTDCAGPISVN